MKVIYKLLLIFYIFLFSSCKTIENKSQEIIKKENAELSKFLQQPESELKIVMGDPDKVIQTDKGTKFYVYVKKNIALLVRENSK